MTTTEKRIAFLVETSPGVWEFQVQRGSLNSPDPVDRALSHAHGHSLVNPESIFISGGSPGSLTEEVLEIEEGQIIINPLTGGGGTVALGNVGIGASMGWTKGVSFPVIFPSDGLNDSIQRHWYTGGGMEEWFYYDPVRAAWLSERVITRIWGFPGIANENSYLYVPAGGFGEQGVYGYQSTDELMLVGNNVIARTPSASPIGLKMWSDTTAIFTALLLTATKLQENDLAVVFPATEITTVQLIGGDTASSLYFTNYYRRHFLS